MIWSVAAALTGAALAVVGAVFFVRSQRSDAVLVESVRRLADGDLLSAIAVPRRQQVVNLPRFSKLSPPGCRWQ